jgi:hypothetical protein
VVGKYVLLARVAGVDWDTAQSLSDEDLEVRLYRPAVPRASYQLTPDFSVIHQELKRPGVTLMLLWEEYATGNTPRLQVHQFLHQVRRVRQVPAVSTKRPPSRRWTRGRAPWLAPRLTGPHHPRQT